MKIKQIGVLSVLGAALCSCNLLSGGGGFCSGYNKINEDGFRMSINANKAVLKTGETFNVPLETSWLYERTTGSLVRETLNCTPGWTYSKSGIVEISKENTKTLQALAVGTTKVTATVTGYYTATEYLVDW